MNLWVATELHAHHPTRRELGGQLQIFRGLLSASDTHTREKKKASDGAACQRRRERKNPRERQAGSRQGFGAIHADEHPHPDAFSLGAGARGGDASKYALQVAGGGETNPPQASEER